MLGGARIVRFVVLQERRITASATVPPTPQSSFSRLPWIHRVNLGRHTNGEYAQKDKTVTTHFFGKTVALFRRQNLQFSGVLFALNELCDTHSEIFRKAF
jgi:hypothetical protein